MLCKKKKKKKKKKHVEYLHLTKALCKFERVISFTSLSQFKKFRIIKS